MKPVKRAGAPAGASLARAATAMMVIVGCQVVALQVVLRGWQSWNEVTVFAGIGVSALLLLCAVALFLYTRPGAGRVERSGTRGLGSVTAELGRARENVNECSTRK